MTTLFLVKTRNSESQNYSDSPVTSGLYNSSNFINEMLVNNGVDSHIFEVNDANNIDKIVTALTPKIVFIEALWVTPHKMQELMKIHPKVKWVVRIHSNAPFLANEGIAMDWIINYFKLGVTIAPNSKKMYEELKIINTSNLVHLPNFYKIKQFSSKHKKEEGVINVGCFGAIRPLKNQLIQALAAIKLSEKLNKKLNFHINSSRVENNGNNVLKNLRGLFDNLNDNFTLVEHSWLPHDNFLKLVSKMDVGMQVSFSETFNIVTCDYVSRNIPIVTSQEVDWVSSRSMCSSTDVNDIVCKLEKALNSPFIKKLNLFNLKHNNFKSEKIWLNFLKK